MKKNRRPFLLLEVLIAIALVSLCILPLLTPYIAIFRDQRQFASKIYLDHAVSLLYADIIEKLHRNAIPWETIAGDQSFPVDSEALQQLTGYAIPWQGNYSFKELKHKPKEVAPFTVYLFRLTFSFKPLFATSQDTKPSEFNYDIFISRQLPGEKAEPPPADDKTKPPTKTPPKAPAIPPAKPQKGT